jgi:hypothetical protein
MLGFEVLEIGFQFLGNMVKQVKKKNQAQKEWKA